MSDGEELLPDIGGDPHNVVHLKPVTAGLESVPSGGFVVKMAKAAKAEALKDALALRLNIEQGDVTLAHEGEDLDDQKTIKENSICEPGPAARRSGMKVVIMFMLDSRVTDAVADARKKAKEDATVALMQGRLEAERSKKELEDRQRKEEEEAKARERRRLEEEAAEKQQADDRVKNRRVIRAAALGGGGGQEVVTASNFTVQELARQLCRELGMLRDEGHQGGLLLLHNGQPLNGRQTLQEQGVQDGDEVLYFWGEGGEAVAEAHLAQ